MEGQEPALLNNVHAEVVSHRVKQGTILWLPEKRVVVESFNKRQDPALGQLDPIRPMFNGGRKFVERMYKHPILVLSRDSAYPERIDFLLMTTHRSTTIADYVATLDERRRPSEMAKHLPIEPYPKHPESNILLKHKYHTVPDRLGMVSVNCVYTMEWCDAKLYWNDHEDLKDRLWELSERSMKQVLKVAHKECQYMPPPRQYVYTPAEAILAQGLEGPRRFRWSYLWPESVREARRIKGDFLRSLQSLRHQWLEVLLWSLIMVLLGAPLLCGLLWVTQFLQFLLSLAVTVLQPVGEVAWIWAAWEMGIALSFMTPLPSRHASHASCTVRKFSASDV